MITMESLKLRAGLMILLFVLLLVGTTGALPDDDRTALREPPPQLAGEQIPVFLVLNEQSEQPGSFAELKADALSRQAQVLQTVRAVDPAAFKTARSYWIANAVWLEADSATLDQLAGLPGVDHIEPDLTVTLNDPVVEVASTIDPDSISQPENGYATVWSVDYIEAPSVWKNGNTGEGVTIAVIDTGIQGDHPAFGDRVVKFADFISGDNSSAYDDHGHGTHCAGTTAGGTVTVDYSGDEFEVALGVAPRANLIGAKVLNSGGSGQFSTILSGAQWAIDNGADVVSMSLGGYPSRDEADTDFYLMQGESRTVQLEVSSEMYGSSDALYEPQFVLGSVRVEEPYYEAYAADAYFADPLENLTITVTDANGNIASGAEIDWLGFDQKTNCYYFKAPYASNTGGWDGVWELNVTNTGETEIVILEAGLAEYYQSNGETILDATVDTMVAGGTVVVISAGNDGGLGTATIGVPGTAKDAITVGATDYLMDYRASFSSMGPVNRAAPYIKPDVMAPGVGIISAYPGSQYASMQGTSMACPAVAGAAALMLSGNSSLTPADVKATLMETAVHIGEDGAILPVMQKNNAYGAGRINAYEAVNATGGLDGAEQWDGIKHELIGGTLASYYVTGDTLPVMAVLWNTTAGAPLAGEELAFSAWYDYYANSQHQYIYIENRTLTTDANGYAYHNVDISDVPVGEDVYARITYGNLQLEDYAYKNAVTPTPTPDPTVPIYESAYYSVAHNATVEIKYPLLAADGSAYEETVAFVVRNSSGVSIIDEQLAPVDGVIAYSLNLAGQPLDVTYYYMRINERSAGSIYVGEEGYMYQEVIPLPDRAICPPGESVNLGIMAFPHHGAKTVSQEFDVYVTTLTETEVLSLSSAGARTLSAPEQGDTQALLAEINAMKPETYSGTASLTNGLALINFTMPEEGYIAIVRFVNDDDYYLQETPVLVYGTLEPWFMHRSTPPVYEDFYDGNLTSIYGFFDWPATWDQDAYASVPGDEATITAYAYTYDPITGAYDLTPGQTIYLYTEEGVATGVTDADGYCTFNINTAGKTQMDCLLITPGVSSYMGSWIGDSPLSPISLAPVHPGMIANTFAAPACTGTLYPDTETRSASVIRDGNTYNVVATSYGPDNEPIHEKGAFVFSRVSETSIWDYVGTEAAAVVDFTGTGTRRVTPATEGNYEARYGLLNPNTQGLDQYLYGTFRNPEGAVSYTMPGTVLFGTSVPVVFNASTDEGAPISGARVVLALGAAGNQGWSSYYDDPRDANILLATDWYPDPYTVIATGYTDANGKATLTFTAPTASQQALRESLARASAIPYMILCYHDGELVQEDGGYLTAADTVPPEPGQDILWDVPLIITSGAFGQTVTLGSAESATREFDAGLDLPMPPDAPGAKKSVYFTSTDPTFGELATDYRPPIDDTNPEEVWTLCIRSDEPVQVTWDTTLLSDGELFLTWNNGTNTIAMKTTSGTTLPAGSYSISISASTAQQIDLPLQVGWNLVSVPFSDAEYTVPQNAILAIYGYNSSTKGYETVSRIESLVPGGAYWIALGRDCTVTVTGTPISPVTAHLKQGWNLIGSTAGQSAFDSIAITPTGSWAMSFVYGYDSQTKGYGQSTELQPGEGYWGAVTRDCTITLP